MTTEERLERLEQRLEGLAAVLQTKYSALQSVVDGLKEGHSGNSFADVWGKDPQPCNRIEVGKPDENWFKDPVEDRLLISDKNIKLLEQLEELQLKNDIEEEKWRFNHSDSVYREKYGLNRIKKVTKIIDV
jgi:hypothetical protein